jgi:hypothetical protein
MPEITVSDLFLSVLVFVLGLLLSSTIQLPNSSRSRRIFLYLWHTAFCFVYLVYASNFGGDAFGYLSVAKSAMPVNFDFGTAAVNFIVRQLVVFGFGTVSIFLLFNLMGAVGLILLDSVLSSIKRPNSQLMNKLVLLFPLLPSISFWSSAVGKDAISFLAICLFLYTYHVNPKNIMVFGASIFLMTLVRPHMGITMLGGWSIMSLTGSQLSFSVKFIYSVFGLTIFALILPFALNYTGLGENASASSVVDYIELRQSYNMQGGGGVDISSLSYPMQIFAYLFRPFIFENLSVSGLMAGIDNLFLVVFVFTLVKLSGWDGLKKCFSKHLGLWSYAIVGLNILALTSANLGISLRQKWMVFPIIIYVLLMALSYRSTMVKSKKKRLSI